MAAFRKMKPNASERGAALILALLVLLLVSTVVAGMIMMASTETNVSGNFRTEQITFFSAKAGMEEARDRLRPNAPNGLSAPTALPGAANGVLYITNPLPGETVTPWSTAGNYYPDTEICKELSCTNGVPTGSPWYTSASASATYAASPQLSWKWVRVMPKTNQSVTGSARVASVDGQTNGTRVCWNGTNEIVTTQPTCPNGQTQVYQLTALAVTPDGTRRMWQTEVAPNLPTPFPAAVAIIGGGQRQCQLQDGTITGNDQATPPGPSVPGIGYSGTNSGCAIQTASVTGGGSCAANPNVCGGLSTGRFSTGATLTTTINNIKMQADNTYTGNVPSPQNTDGTLGTCDAFTTNPKITVINSANAAFNGVTGCGLLLIDAAGQTALEISGSVNWKGPVIVYSSASQVQVQIDSGSGYINGALLIATNNTSEQIQFQFQGYGLAGGIRYNSFYNGISQVTPLFAITKRELIY